MLNLQKLSERIADDATNHSVRGVLMAALKLLNPEILSS